MKILILTFGTAHHGEVIVKYKDPFLPMTQEAVARLSAGLLDSYRTRRRGIPLKEFRRARCIEIRKTPVR